MNGVFPPELSANKLSGCKPSPELEYGGALRHNTTVLKFRPGLAIRAALLGTRHKQHTHNVLTMDAYDSDSSGIEEGDYTETGVLLGYASKEPTEDTISHLGGHPVSCHNSPNYEAKN